LFVEIDTTKLNQVVVLSDFELVMIA